MREVKCPWMYIPLLEARQVTRRTEANVGYRREGYLVPAPSILLRSAVSSIILITHRRSRARTPSQIRICTYGCQSTASGSTSCKVMRRKVGYHIVIVCSTRGTVEISGMSIGANEGPVTAPAPIPPMLDTLDIVKFLLSLLPRARGRSPIDGVESVIEIFGGRELPFTDDGPDDDCTSDTGRYDDDGNDGVASEMTAAAT